MTHDYRSYRDGQGRFEVCEHCGTAKHADGWFWLSGFRSKHEPPCANPFNLAHEVYADWLASSEKMPFGLEEGV